MSICFNSSGKNVTNFKQTSDLDSFMSLKSIHICKNLNM